MDRKLLNYLPPVLKEVADFIEINEANEPEISLAWDALALVLANQFLDSATEWGVSSWENDLGILPKDTDTLEERKIRLKAMWNMKQPYTVSWLRQWITGICGPTGHEEVVSDYTIGIQLDYTILPNADALALQILEMLLEIRPENMRVLIALRSNPIHTVIHPATAVGTVYTTVLPALTEEVAFFGTAYVGMQMSSVTQTELPEI